MTDWDFWWDLVSNMSLAGMIVIRACFLCGFVKPFLENKKYMALVWGSYAVPMLVQMVLPKEIGGMTAHAVGVMAAFLVIYLIDRRNGEQKIFLAVTFYLLICVAWGITLMPWKMLYYLLLLAFDAPHNIIVQFILYIVMEVQNLAMHCFVMAFCTRIIHREYRYKMENMTRGELALTLTPLFSIIAGQGIFQFAVNAYEKDTDQYIWNRHGSYSWFQGFYMLSAFAVVLAVIVFWKRLRESQRREKEDAVLAGQTADMKKHISEVEKLYLDIRSLKHDMRNHVMTLERLCGENEEAGKYLRQLKEQVSTVLPDMKSGNPVTDVILREKQKEAQERGIVFENRFHFPEGTGVSAFDVGVILNNALDNALEATGECRDARVSVSSYPAGNACMIEIENSAAGIRSIDKENGLPLTTKTGADHGFGLVNIRRTAQKYYGDIDIAQDGETFRLTVMLMRNGCAG